MKILTFRTPFGVVRIDWPHGSRMTEREAEAAYAGAVAGILHEREQAELQRKRGQRDEREVIAG